MADYPDDVIKAMVEAYANTATHSHGMRAALRAADTAMLAHGWKRVPREPTDAMKLHGTYPTTPLSTWRAMYDAAPEVKS